MSDEPEYIIAKPEGGWPPAAIYEEPWCCCKAVGPAETHAAEDAQEADGVIADLKRRGVSGRVKMADVAGGVFVYNADSGSCHFYMGGGAEAVDG